ncbi:DUF5518 domain-containing protein [Halorarius halobius]|uniref:DUF5518 domain-containing protein n=1 Tax=Halorarius halobius TaxID=2962671 RepID=UPI0020CD0003|nr:DUF5518 domain-containing protein [Halorarius halobius]
MNINWRAIGAGIVAAIVLGLVSGAVVPFTDLSLPVVGGTLAAVIAGAVAGYVNGSDMSSGAVHGGLATTIGLVVVGLFLTTFGILFGGLFGVGLGVLLVGLVVIAAIPGAFGGVVGAWLQGRTAEPEMTARPQA